MPPSQLTGLLTSLEGRYAKTLYDLSREADCVEAVIEDYQSFIQILDDHTDLQDILLSAAITRDEHIKVLEALSEKLKLNPILQDFFHLLADHGRLNHLRAIQNIVQKIYDEQQNKHSAEVVSAQPLTPSQQRQISELLNSQVSGTLSLTFTTNPHLLGGFYVRNQNRVMDGTFAKALTKLINTMKGKA